MNPETSAGVSNLVIGLVVSGAVSALAMLTRRAFSQIEESIAALSAKVDGLVSSYHATDTALALVQQQLAEMKAETLNNRQRMHDLKDQLSPAFVKSSVLEERVRLLEDRMRELSEGGR